MLKFEKIRTADDHQDNIAHDKNLRQTSVCFQKGDTVMITEKIDGANTSVRRINGQLHVYGHRQELTASDPTGFYAFIMAHKDAFGDLDESHILFGEWLIKHTVQYRPTALRKWYLFDIFDLDFDEFLGLTSAIQFVNGHDLGPDIQTVPVLATRKDVTEANLLKIATSYFDQSKVATNGRTEGVVMTDLDTHVKINDLDQFGPLRIKVVDSIFKERKATHQRHPKALTSNDKQLAAWTDCYITTARIRKQLLECRDEGLVPDKMSTAWLRDKTLMLKLTAIIKKDAVSETPKAEQPALIEAPAADKLIRAKLSRFIGVQSQNR